eukprot:Em0001g2918a
MGSTGWNLKVELQSFNSIATSGVVNNPGCPYKVGRQCGACGVLALYHWSELGPEVAVGYLGTPVMMLKSPDRFHIANQRSVIQNGCRFKASSQSHLHVSMMSSLRDGPQLTMRLLCDHISTVMSSHPFTRHHTHTPSSAVSPSPQHPHMSLEESQVVMQRCYLTGWLSCGERRMELLGGEGVKCFCAEPLTWNGIAMITLYLVL